MPPLERLNIAIVSKRDHAKAHAAGLTDDGYTVVLVGEDGDRLTDAHDLIVCRIASCSHHGSKIAREWAKRTGKPLILEDGLAGIRRRIRELVVDEEITDAFATVLTRTHTKSASTLVVPNVRYKDETTLAFGPYDRDELIERARTWSGTQKSFAQQFGVSQATASRWRRTRPEPSVQEPLDLAPQPEPQPQPETPEPPMTEPDYPLPPRRGIDNPAIPAWMPDALGEHLLEVMSYLAETGITELTVTATGFRWKRVTVSEGEVKL